MIEQLSVSQVEVFDHQQRGGCERRWWFENVRGLRAEQKASQEEGEAGHALLAQYFKTGALPKKRTMMGKAVTGAIVKGELPKPGGDLFVEERFDGQEKFGPDGVTWLPLDRENTLSLAGVPFDGFIDLAFRRSEVPEIWDHKFSVDIHENAKPASGLIKTVQMPVYVLSQLPFWPDAKRWRIVHHNVSRKGVDSLIRGATVELDQVLERKAQIEAVIERMKPVSEVVNQDDVRANRTPTSCEAWGGCPHQSICSAFRKGNTVSMSQEEDELFAQFNAELAQPEPEVPPAPPPPSVNTEEPRKRRMNIVEVSNPDVAPQPMPEQPAAESDAPCACGAKVNSLNGSKLQSGQWKHIGCPLDAPPVEPKQRRAKKPDPVPVAEKPAEPQAPPVAQTLEAAPVEPPKPPPMAKPPGLVRLTMPNERTDAIASVLESIAKLLRT